MKIENIIRKVLREQEEKKLLKIPGLKFFNNDWNVLQKFLESQGNPRYSIGGNLDLRAYDIKTLGNLVRVGGFLDLGFSDIKSLGNLERVGGSLNLASCKNLQSLGDLKYVDGWLDLGGTRIETLGNLEYVGGWLDLGRTPLSKKYTEEEIRDMIGFVGKVYL